LKPDYYKGVSDTLDCLIIGGYFGEGKSKIGTAGEWTDNITHFMLGLSSKINMERPKESEFFSFVRVGSGYTGRELETLRAKMKGHWRHNAGKETLPFLRGLKELKSNDRPDVVIDSPENSFIFEINFSEIMKSHAPGFYEYTLRFPRVQKIRYDKEWFECLSESEFRKMLEEGNRKNLLKKKRASGEIPSESNVSDFGAPTSKVGRKKLQKTGSTASGVGGKSLEVHKQFQDTNVTGVVKKSNTFGGREFLVINTSNDLEMQGEGKQNLEIEIVRHGGRKVQNYSPYTTQFVVAERREFRVQTLIDSFQVSVLRPEWVRDCVKAEKIAEITPRHVLHANRKMKRYKNSRNPA
jgi:DNA ligase 4